MTYNETETTTKTNLMLNKPKVCRVIGLKPQANDRNISVQHIATLLATEKNSCRNWEVNESLPFLPISFLLSSFASYIQMFRFRPKGQYMHRPTGTFALGRGGGGGGCR